jgi:Fe-S cluster assembly iron-binding protein IscA
MDIADGPRKGDLTIEMDGLTVFLECEANAFLSDATIDFPDERGFVISGMKRSSCCG